MDYATCLNRSTERERKAMCGVAGVWGTVDEDVVRRMMDVLIHRGPDDAGTFLAKKIGVLGHRRLSIMDPVGGRQPIELMANEGAIVANGEIYNNSQLRVELSGRHRFRTRRDCLHFLKTSDGRQKN